MKPIDFPCSTCSAAAGAKCWHELDAPIGFVGMRAELPYYHAARVDVAIEALDAALRSDVAAAIVALDAKIRTDLDVGAKAAAFAREIDPANRTEKP